MIQNTGKNASIYKGAPTLPLTVLHSAQLRFNGILLKEKLTSGPRFSEYNKTQSAGVTRRLRRTWIGDVSHV